MPIWFILSIILFIIGILWLLGAPSKYRTIGGEIVNLKPASVVPIGLALIALLISMFSVVGTRDVGVETAWNKPTGKTVGAGLDLHAPWINVTDIDGSIQPEEYRGDDCIYVKIADGGSACVSVAYRWRINPEGADKVFADYRNSDLDITDAVRKALVSTNIKAAINEVLGGYDPLSGAELEPGMSPEELANAKVNVVPDYEQINKDITSNVENKISNLGDLILIESITVSYVSLPEQTQARINAFNAAVQETKIALQQVATKKAQAQGNNELAKSLQDPNVLVSKCLDALAAGEFTAPAGFSCWPTGGSDVVIPAAR